MGTRLSFPKLNINSLSDQPPQRRYQIDVPGPTTTLSLSNPYARRILSEQIASGRSTSMFN